MKRLFGKLTVGKVITAVVLLLLVVAVAVLLFGKSPFERDEQYIIMSDDQFADNPVLFRDSRGTVSVPEIDRTNAKAVLASISRPEQMSWEVRRTLYGGGKSQTRVARYNKNGGNFTVDLRTAGGEQTAFYSKNGDRVTIRTGGQSRTEAYSEQLSAEAVMGVLDIDYFLSAPDANIAMAELREKDGENCLYVEYREPAAGITERCYISLYYGVVLKADSYSGERLVWSAETLSLSGR